MAKLRNIAMASTAVLALATGLSISASASTLPFQVTPAGIPGVAGPVPFTATDIQGVSAALVQQTGPTTQVETGWLEFTTMTNAGSPLLSNVTGLGATYNLYITFTAVVQGLTGFGAQPNGTISSFTFSIFADPGAHDAFNTGTPTASGGTQPSVTDSDANDILLGTGNLKSGSAGFEPSTGAPFFDVVTSFILNAAGSAYFTQPVPFYNIAFTSTNPSSVNNITPFGGTLNPGAPPNATINSIATDTSFIPEPASLALLGTGLLGMGAALRRRRRKPLA